MAKKAEKKKAKVGPKAKPTKKAVSPKSKKPTKLAVPATTKIIAWKAPDYYTFEKSPYWSLGIGALAIVLCAILIFTQNYFPIIIIVLAVIVTFQIAHERPPTQEFALDEGGILSRNSYLPYLEIKSFWVAKHGNKSVLYLEPVNRAKSAITIPLGNQNPNEVKDFLLRFVPEKFEYGELLSEKLIRIFRL